VTKQQLILSKLAESLKLLSKQEPALRRMNRMAIAGQSVAYLIAIQDDIDQESRDAALFMFDFFTMQAFGYSAAAGAIRTIADKDFRRIILPENETFAEDHNKVLESGELRDFLMAGMNDWFEESDAKMKELAATLHQRMVRVINNEDFPEYIEEGKDASA
jgi:hypothetical protein